LNTLVRVLAASLLCLHTICASAAIDLDALGEDLKQQKITKESFKFALWMPPEFFIASAGNANEESTRQLNRMLDGYMLFMVADAQVSTFGGLTPTPRSELLRKTTLVVNNGVPLTPVSDEDLKPDFKTLREVLRPVMKNVVGSLGESLELMVFKLPANGPSMIKPAGEGRVKLTTVGQDYVWRLPLGSVLPPMFDPDSGDRFPGNYRFNPYTGKSLQPK